MRVIVMLIVLAITCFANANERFILKQASNNKLWGPYELADGVELGNGSMRLSSITNSSFSVVGYVRGIKKSFGPFAFTNNASVVLSGAKFTLITGSTLAEVEAEVELQNEARQKALLDEDKRNRELKEERRQKELEKNRLKEKRAKDKLSSAQLVLNSWSWSVEHGYITAEGQVGNISGVKLENVQAVVQFYTEDGEFVTSDSSIIEFNPLMPGQLSPFKVMEGNNPLIKSASISFKIMFGDALSVIKREDYDKASR